MPRMQVYLPDDLYEQVKARGALRGLSGGSPNFLTACTVLRCPAQNQNASYNSSAPRRKTVDGAEEYGGSDNFPPPLPIFRPPTQLCHAPRVTQNPPTNFRQLPVNFGAEPHNNARQENFPRHTH